MDLSGEASIKASDTSRSRAEAAIVCAAGLRRAMSSLQADVLIRRLMFSNREDLIDCPEDGLRVLRVTVGKSRAVRRLGPKPVSLDAAKRKETVMVSEEHSLTLFDKMRKFTPYPMLVRIGSHHVDR